MLWVMNIGNDESDRTSSEACMGEELRGIGVSEKRSFGEVGDRERTRGLSEAKCKGQCA